jgi:hypothetical protein
MRTIYFKTIDNTFEIFESNNTSIILQEALPFGIEYRHICSCELSQEQINAWWDYVDELLLEHPTPDYYSVWKIIENGVIYGYEN